MHSEEFICKYLSLFAYHYREYFKLRGKKKIQTIALLLFAVCLYIIILYAHWTFEPQYCTVNEILEELNERKVCINKNIGLEQNANFWKKVIEIWKDCSINRCSDEKLFQIVSKNNDDQKLALFESASSAKIAPCTIITLGVGGDIEAEKNMLRINRNCTFFGADPISEYRNVFSEIGKFYPIAVAAKKGVIKTIVRIPQEKTEYVNATVVTTDFLSLLQSLKVSHIDHLWIDNEGAEYELLDTLKSGGELEVHNITVCQINVEFHDTHDIADSPSLEMRAQAVQSFLSRSKFILYYIDQVYRHHRGFFINNVDDYCVQNFLSSDTV